MNRPLHSRDPALEARGVVAVGRDLSLVRLAVVVDVRALEVPHGVIVNRHGRGRVLVAPGEIDGKHDLATAASRGQSQNDEDDAKNSHREDRIRAG